MSATTTTTPSAAPARDGWRTSLRRTVLLGRVNWTLMVRNRTTLLYAFLMPALPLVLLVVGTRGGQNANIDPSAGTIAAALLFALVFPGYYNLLSMFVTRRDELVLKRLRTGEVRDSELIASMALPGAAVTFVVAVVSVVLAAVLGLPMPTNPLLLLLAVLLAIGTFAAFAIWTASWTQTAESAQLTSAPVIALSTVGFVVPVLPSAAQPWVELTPGAAVELLLRISWFGQERAGSEPGMSFAQTWVEAAPSLGALAVWALLAVVVARRSLRWEPRA